MLARLSRSQYNHRNQARLTPKTSGTFYESYRVEVCTTIREYEFHEESDITNQSL